MILSILLVSLTLILVLTLAASRAVMTQVRVRAVVIDLKDDLASPSGRSSPL